MASLPLGNDNDLDDSQFYNRVDEISFISDNLEIAKKGSTPTILLTGIRGVGKNCINKKIKKKTFKMNIWLSIWIYLQWINLKKINLIVFAL